MAINLPSSPGIKLKVASAEVQRVKAEGPLYYILPPALVLAVLIFCYTATPPVAAPDDFADELTEDAPAATSDEDLSDMLD